jgi:lipoprotein-releasing system permease protein
VANFFIQQDIDRQYVITDIDFVRQLMRYEPDEVTSLALKLKAGADPDKVKQRISSEFRIPDSGLTVKDRYDQQPLYFKIYRTERLGIYLILSLIILISTLSLVASLSLLILNKKDDIFMLRSMGMERRNIRHAFLLEGLLICATAVVAGLVLGFLICFLQQQFGIIGMGDGNFVVPSFPVAMRAVDFLSTFLLVMAISALSVSLTVRRARI